MHSTDPNRVSYPEGGSTGYGAPFMRANINDWGGGDYRDIMAGVDELVRRSVADADRLAFEGWSYGAISRRGWCRRRGASRPP